MHTLLKLNGSVPEEIGAAAFADEEARLFEQNMSVYKSKEPTGILSRIGCRAALGSRGGVSNGFCPGAPSKGLDASFLVLGELKGFPSSLVVDGELLNEPGPSKLGPVLDIRQIAG